MAYFTCCRGLESLPLWEIFYYYIVIHEYVCAWYDRKYVGLYNLVSVNFERLVDSIFHSSYSVMSSYSEWLLCLPVQCFTLNIYFSKAAVSGLLIYSRTFSAPKKSWAFCICCFMWFVHWWSSFWQESVALRLKLSCLVKLLAWFCQKLLVTR